VRDLVRVVELPGDLLTAVEAPALLDTCDRSLLKCSSVASFRRIATGARVRSSPSIKRVAVQDVLHAFTKAADPVLVVDESDTSDRYGVTANTRAVLAG
jgi:hypothetical protein